MELSNWWDALSLLEKIYWLTALPSTIIFTVQLIMTIVGADSHGLGHDFDSTDLDHGPDFNLFSPKTIVSFLVIFGWSGLTALKYGIISKFAIIGLSIAAGFVMMLITAWVFFLFTKLQQSGTLNMNNAIGKVGEVYITIPGRKKSQGKIQIIVQSSLRTLDAVTEDAEDLKPGTQVEVLELFGDDILVVRKAK